uniref:F-box domain-containing protein n=1 Tax=Steinernema glaseri TaxID=37863 RepID=A0A1I7Z300_9BILA
MWVFVMSSRRRKGSLSSSSAVDYKRKLRNFSGRGNSVTTDAPLVVTEEHQPTQREESVVTYKRKLRNYGGRKNLKTTDESAPAEEEPPHLDDVQKVASAPTIDIHAPMNDEGTPDDQEIQMTESSNTVVAHRRLECQMDNIPFEFATNVIANFRSISELDHLTGVWHEAYQRAAEKRRVYEFLLRVARAGNEPGSGAPYFWEYQFRGTNTPTIDELLKMDRRYFRGTNTPTIDELLKMDRRYVLINHVVVKNFVYSTKPFHTTDFDKLTQVVLPFVGKQVMNKVEFDCHLLPIHTLAAESIFKQVCACRIFKNISISYCGQASEDFLSSQVDSGQIWELSLGGNWPLSAQYILIKFVTTSFWYVNMRESNFEMDKTLFSVIYNHWKKGVSRGFKIISAVDRIGRDLWEEFFGVQPATHTPDSYILKHPDNDNESETQRNLRLNFEADGRITLWC